MVVLSLVFKKNNKKHLHLEGVFYLTQYLYSCSFPSGGIDVWSASARSFLGDPVRDLATSHAEEWHRECVCFDCRHGGVCTFDFTSFRYCELQCIGVRNDELAVHHFCFCLCCNWCAYLQWRSRQNNGNHSQFFLCHDDGCSGHCSCYILHVHEWWCDNIEGAWIYVRYSGSIFPFEVI